MELDEAVDLRPRRRGPALIAAAVIGVLLVLLVVVLATRDPAQDRVGDSPLVGHVAPPLAGETLAGASFDLDRLRGQWVVVNFFATWCVPCQAEHPELVEFSERHAEAQDASVVSVVFDDEAEEVGRFFDRNGGEWPVVDGEGIILDWAVAAVPESYLVSPGGVVVAKVTGGVTADGLDDLLDSVAQRSGADTGGNS
jgi:cytochrome c biogenesis protein CcmG, thiol:disulfide interchange protein DsbE